MGAVALKLTSLHGTYPQFIMNARYRGIHMVMGEDKLRGNKAMSRDKDAAISNGSRRPQLKKKKYENRLAKLHVELVKLQ